MAVVVEALTLVVRRAALDASYPGGADAYLEDLTGRGRSARWACADEHLAAASYYTPDIAHKIRSLMEYGFVYEDNGTCVDLTVIDELTGPVVPCDWISWKRDPGVSSVAWLASENPGELATPDGWTPAHLARSDVRDEDGMFKLAEEGGVETWLDTGTGEVLCGPADRAGNAPGPLMQGIRSALERQCWPYTTHGPRVVRAAFQAGVLMHDLEVKVQEAAGLVSCRGSLPLVVPRRERGPDGSIEAALASLNERAGYKAYVMDHETGRISGSLVVEVSDRAAISTAAHTIIREIASLCRSAERRLLIEAVRWPHMRG